MRPPREIACELVDQFWEKGPQCTHDHCVDKIAEAIQRDRDQAKSAFACEAYWRLVCVTPDANTQTEDEIRRQDETYERRLLEYLCDELTEHCEPLTFAQRRAVQERLAEVRARAGKP